VGLKVGMDVVVSRKYPFTASGYHENSVSHRYAMIKGGDCTIYFDAYSTLQGKFND
jgi:hypothetical protein